LRDTLKPGGLCLIYNIGSARRRAAPAWADTRAPFAARAWRACGFEVLMQDTDDTSEMRAYASALGWQRGAHAVDLQNLRASVTIARRALALVSLP
jgi:hypothetical protein